MHLPRQVSTWWYGARHERPPLAAERAGLVALTFLELPARSEPSRAEPSLASDVSVLHARESR